jgi:hypothetical protein
LSRTPTFAALALFIGVLPPSTSAAGTAALQRKFDARFTQNIEAASGHYWEQINCKRRDKDSGMPTSTLTLPGATRSYVDATEYTATYIFPIAGAGQMDLHAFVRSRAFVNVPADFETDEYEEDSSSQIRHRSSPDDHVTVELTDRQGELIVTFRPPQSVPIPFGNPCAKPPHNVKR